MNLELITRNSVGEAKATPLLVIGAEKDTVIFPKLVEDTARRYGTKAEIFPDTAHNVMLEAGWEKVAKQIFEWLGTMGI